MPRFVLAALCCSLLGTTAVQAENFRQVCKVHVLCAGTEPGGGRIIGCLRAHKAELSVPCRLAIADFFLNKKGRHDDAGVNDHRRGGPEPSGDEGPDGPPPGDHGPGPEGRGAPDGPDDQGGPPPSQDPDQGGPQR